MKAQNVARVGPKLPPAGGSLKRGLRLGMTLTRVVPVRPIRYREENARMTRNLF